MNLQLILNRTDDNTIAECLKGESNALVRKVLVNISKRRAKSIETIYREPKRRNNESVKEEMQKTIRNHFEERFGRVLKIPERTHLRYTVAALSEEGAPGFSWHSGDIVVLRGKELFIYRNLSPKGSSPAVFPSPGPCERYDLESSRDMLFSVCAVTESAVLLKCEGNLKTAMIHIYDWTTNIERCEIVEDLTEHTILPLVRSSDAVVFTIGAIDRKNRGREQVIRLKIH